MKIADVKKMDWKQDMDLLVVERKAASLSERVTMSVARLTELGKIIHDAEKALIQSRAATLLDDPPDEPEKVVLERISSARLEISEIDGNLAALRLAQAKLQPAIAAAEAEARMRLAASLVAPYLRTVANLKALLTQAVEANRVLHEIHNLAVRQGLAGEIGRNPAIRPLGNCLAWNRLTTQSGDEGGEFANWKTYCDQALGAD